MCCPRASRPRLRPATWATCATAISPACPTGSSVRMSPPAATWTGPARPRTGRPDVLPPRRVRRFTGPLLIAALAVAVISLPALVVVAVVASVLLPGRWYALRLLGFALVYLALEVLGLAVAAVLWALSGFGRRSDSPAFRAAHYTMLRLLLDVLMRTAERLFALRLVTDGASWSPLDDGVPGSTNAMVVLSRHAGPGDSFLLVHTLMNRDHLRQPRIVLKDVLQLDPLIDVYLNRLPNHFVTADPGAGYNSAEAIADLARGMGDEDALLIFPEGANFTPQRRVRAIKRLRDRGLATAVRRAEAMRNVLPPHPAGVTAALRAAPHADVVFVAHTGLEHLSTVRDVWRGLPTDKTLHLRWWFIRPPRYRATRASRPTGSTTGGRPSTTGSTPRGNSNRRRLGTSEQPSLEPMVHGRDIADAVHDVFATDAAVQAVPKPARLSLERPRPFQWRGTAIARAGTWSGAGRHRVLTNGAAGGYADHCAREEPS